MKPYLAAARTVLAIFLVSLQVASQHRRMRTQRLRILEGAGGTGFRDGVQAGGSL